MKKTFNGGIDFHETPLALKGLADYKNVRTIAPKKVYLPVQQHIGDAAEVVVSPGEHVLLGQKIADIGDNLGAHVHASVSGTVRAIEKRDQGQGEALTCVVIENDFHDQLAEQTVPETFDRETILAQVSAAGVVGLGGATFPSHVKLDPAEQVEWCIFNGAECEPLLMADAALMVNDGEKLLGGIQLVLAAVAAKRGVLAIESDKQEALAVMRVFAQAEPRLTVVEVPSVYPQGASEMLIKAVTGKELPLGASARDLGILMINVATTVAVYDALHLDRALSHRICSVVGDVKMPQNILFPLGTTAEELIAACGGVEGQLSRVIVGGFMMGKSIDTLHASLTKAANGLIVINKAHDQDRTPKPCIKCARCVAVCPMRLLPLWLEKAALKNDHTRLQKLRVAACINCGCCTTVCPARRHLAEHIVAGQKEVKQHAD
ncbi:electron transport complex subunit RsxC [Enterococcus sp. CSURQ0835]|uniref:electron transport complex subunit RsxC n=1 Tax=Enterococcus sp. CSURQ0835 TaxID=2681394 RepID=UPI00135CD12B|nr:electron transport complex subunit RsxC [Enterococcus sp. CSURQ0835]